MPFLCEVWSLLLQQHFCLSQSVLSQLVLTEQSSARARTKISHSMTSISVFLSVVVSATLPFVSIPLSSVIVLLFDTPAGFCGELDVALIVVKCRLNPVRTVATLSQG